MNKRSGSAAVVVVAFFLVILIVGGYWLTWYRKSVAIHATQPTSIAQPELNLNILKNGQYVYAVGTDYLSGEKQKFTNGTTPKVNDQGMYSWSELDASHIAFGDLNNDGQMDAAVMITHMLDASVNGGTGGNDMVLNVILNQNGNLFVAANTWIGMAKFNTVNSIVIQNGVVSMETSDDGLPFSPSKTTRFKLAGNKLIKL